MFHCFRCEHDIAELPSVYGDRVVLKVFRKPSKRGNVVIDDNGRARVYGEGEAANARARGERTYLQHAGACDDALASRKKKAA